MVIGEKLENFPKIHTLYMKFCYFFEEYITYLPFKFYYLGARMKVSNRKTMFFYPEKPIYFHAIHQVCYFSGFSITNNPKKADFVINFEDTTYRKKHALLDRLNKKMNVINYACRDISKKHVDKIHKKTFGYGLSIDPRTYKGIYVKKGDINSLHNGTVIDHPEKPEKGYVYQVLVNNVVKDESIEMRVPIFGKIIPFIYLKYRPISNRFGSFNNKVQIAKTEKLISPEEYNKILNFCRGMGLDCGELDVLRDNKTKKLYIVDVNNTPSSPPFQLPRKDFKLVLSQMSKAFQSAFVSQRSPAMAKNKFAFSNKAQSTIKSALW